jgi:hypothetical protein
MKRDWAFFIKELPAYGMPEELEKALSKAAVRMLEGAK